MATVQRRLVHKQFNSPIALYSDTNVKETLDRELKVLSSGAVGIDFDDPSTTRPGMLAKSAVLAALEEEENAKRGHQTGLKRVAWPPPPDSSFADEAAAEEQQQQQQFVQPPVQAQQYVLPPTQQQYHPQPQQQLSPAHQPQQPQYFYQEPAGQQATNVLTAASKPNYLNKTAPVPVDSYQKPGPPPSSLQSPKSPQRPRPVSLQTFIPTPTPAAPSPSTNANHILPSSPHSAGVVSKPLSPLSHLNTSQPPFNNSTSYSPSLASTATYSAKSPLGWAHVDSPVSASNQQYRNQYQNQNQNQYQSNYYPTQISPSYELTSTTCSTTTTSEQTSGTYFGQQQNYQPVPTQTFKPVAGAPKSQIYQPTPFTGNPLRKEAPIHQRPAPVFASQPVAAKFKGGVNMRGDQKWPPVEYKQQAAEENEQRKQIALGPAFRPKRVNKDYTRFFAQNALNATYPGYKAPPGTQHIGNNNS